MDKIITDIEGDTEYVTLFTEISTNILKCSKTIKKIV